MYKKIIAHNSIDIQKEIKTLKRLFLFLIKNKLDDFKFPIKEQADTSHNLSICKNILDEIEKHTKQLAETPLKEYLQDKQKYDVAKILYHMMKIEEKASNGLVFFLSYLLSIIDEEYFIEVRKFLIQYDIDECANILSTQDINSSARLLKYKSPAVTGEIIRQYLLDVEHYFEALSANLIISPDNNLKKALDNLQPQLKEKINTIASILQLIDDPEFFGEIFALSKNKNIAILIIYLYLETISTDNITDKQTRILNSFKKSFKQQF